MCFVPISCRTERPAAPELGSSAGGRDSVTSGPNDSYATRNSLDIASAHRELMGTRDVSLSAGREGRSFASVLRFVTAIRFSRPQRRSASAWRAPAGRWQRVAQPLGA